MDVPYVGRGSQGPIARPWEPRDRVDGISSRHLLVLRRALMNAFFALCQLGMFGWSYRMILAGGPYGVDLAGVIDRACVVMF